MMDVIFYNIKFILVFDNRWHLLLSTIKSVVMIHSCPCDHIQFVVGFFRSALQRDKWHVALNFDTLDRLSFSQDISQMKSEENMTTGQ